MRRQKKGLEAAIGTQHDDGKGLKSADNGKIGLGAGSTQAPPPMGGSSKQFRRSRKLDG